MSAGIALKEKNAFCMSNSFDRKGTSGAKDDAAEARIVFLRLWRLL